MFSNTRAPGGSQKGVAILWNPTESWHEQTPQELPPLILSRGTDQWLNSFGADWSPDGRKIAGTIGFRGSIAIYHLGTRQYREMRNFESTRGDFALGLRWLNDGRRLLFMDFPEGTLKLLDTETETEKEILSVVPDRLGVNFCLSKSNDLIYFTRSHREADIWMLTLDEER